MAETNEKQCYRLPPCPDYDIEGTESWLSDMAASGLHLSRDGFFAGFAIFNKETPRAMRYRLDAAPKKAGLFAEGAEPDEEAVSLSAASGWDYVTARGQFLIYRTSDPEAPELHTDPQVQALAINQIRRRERGSVVTSFLWLFLYPLLWVRGEWLLTMLNVGTWFILYSVLLVTWLFAGTVARAIHFRRLRGRLSRGEPLNHRKGWRKTAPRHRAGGFVLLACCLVWLGIFLRLWSDDLTDVGKTPLDAYTGDPPFATMADLAPGGDYALNDFGISNTVEIRRDWLAPTVIHWGETATVTLPDGRTASGGLYVDYYETASPWLAREVAREYLRSARRGKHYEALSLPPLGVDYAAAYLDGLHFPTLLLQHGDRVLKAQFYQTSPDFEISLAEWTQLMAASIR